MLMMVDFSKLDLNDPEVQKLIAIIQKDDTYNTRLKEFLDQAYDWQKEAVMRTAISKVTGVICGNQMGKSEIACAIAACHLTGYYPDWWEGKKYDRPVNLWIAGPDGRHNRDVLQKRLFGTDNKKLNKELGTGMIPRESINMDSVVSVRSNDIESVKIKHKSGGESSLSFRAYTQIEPNTPNTLMLYLYRLNIVRSH